MNATPDDRQTAVCGRCGAVYFVADGHACTRRLVLTDEQVGQAWDDLLPELEPAPAAGGRHRARRPWWYWLSRRYTTQRARVRMLERAVTQLLERDRQRDADFRAALDMLARRSR
jgi:hypothetical protein